MFTQSKYLSNAYFENPDGFSWPLDRDKSVRYRDNFLRGLITHCASNDQKTEFSAYYPILCIHWSSHMMQFYNGLTLRTSECKNLENCKDPVIRALINDTDIPAPAYLKQLEMGPHNIQWYLRPARLLKHLLLKSGVPRKIAQFTNFQKEIIVTTTGAVISAHMKQHDKPVYYFPQSTWFGSLNPADLDLDVFDQDADILWGFVVSAFEDDRNLIDKERFEKWFKGIFKQSLALCNGHIQTLTRRSKYLPNTVWIGTGSNLWDRMLKFKVDQNGGQVTGHDHGAGVGHLISKSRTLSECFACHHFASWGQRKHFENSVYAPFLIIKKPSVIEIPNATKIKTGKIEKRMGKKVLIMPAAPESSVPRFIGAAMEPVQADFLNMLFIHLKDQGYEVLIKPHPELEPLIHDSYFEKNGAKILRGNLKEAYSEADIILFQHIHTTTFREAFEQGKHIAFIDMCYDEWTDEAQIAVQKRCSAIAAHYDENNRIQINWEKLSGDIERARDLNDHSFAKMYFS